MTTSTPLVRSGCRADPCSVVDSCGQNAECRNEIDRRSSSGAMRPVCVCPPRHVGNPYDRCIPGEEKYCTFLVALFLEAPCVHPSAARRVLCESRRCRASRVLVAHTEGDSGSCTVPTTCAFSGDCLGNSECPVNQACKDYRCIDPCLTSCGQGAECEVQNHVAICRCGRGMTGDPFRVRGTPGTIHCVLRVPGVAHQCYQTL